MILDNRMKLLAIPPTENWRDAILYWAEQYEQTVSRAAWEREKELLALRPTVRRDKHLTKVQLETLVHWKLRTKLGYIRQTCEDYIVKKTSAAFRTTDIHRSIDHLSELHGIGLSVGSAILHLFHEADFPIFDQHALRAVGEEYDERLWQSYVVYCRNVAKATNVSMRTLDRALYRFRKVLKTR